MPTQLIYNSPHSSFFLAIFHAEQAAIFNAILYIIQNFATAPFLSSPTPFQYTLSSTPYCSPSFIFPFSMDTVPLLHHTQRQGDSFAKQALSSLYASPYNVLPLLKLLTSPKSHLLTIGFSPIHQHSPILIPGTHRPTYYSQEAMVRST